MPGTLRSLHIDRDLAITVVCSLIVAMISTYLHHPGTPVPLNDWGLKYSDIVHGVFMDRFKIDPFIDAKAAEERWYRVEVLRALASGRKLCPIPYLDYRFEYPPVIGALWWFSTCIAIHLAFPKSYEVYEYLDLVDRAAVIHFYIHAVALTIALIAVAVIVYRIVRELGYGLARVLLFLFLPSTILYSVYNWDLIAIAFALAGIYAFYRGRYTLSGILLGLSIATKILPVAVAIALSYELVQKMLRRERVYEAIYFFVALTLASLLPFVFLGFVSFRGLLDMVGHHAGWYCENCIYQIAIPDPWSPAHRILAVLAISIAMVFVLSRPIDSLHTLIRTSFVSMLIVTTLNYVFTPQMILMLSPLAVLAIDVEKLLKLFIAADIANFSIMALFFKDEEIRSILGPYLGLEIKFSPWTLDSPIQWIAVTRNIFLLAILAVSLKSLLTSLSSQLDKNPYIASTEVRVYGTSESHDLHKGGEGGDAERDTEEDQRS